MRRTNFFLKEEQLKLLEKERVKTGVPSSELVRRLIDKYFEKELKKSK